MDADAQIETELEVLERIVTLLLALAALADRASRAPYPVRAFVLWLLRRAETAVREWVAAPDHPWPVAIRVGSEPHDALDLAASFRALAHAVEDMAADDLRLGRLWRGLRQDLWQDSGQRKRRAVADHRGVGPGSRLSSRTEPAATPYDTS